MNTFPHRSVDNRFLATAQPPPRDSSNDNVLYWFGFSELFTGLMLAALVAAVGSAVKAFRESGLSRVEKTLIDPLAAKLSAKIEIIEDKIVLLSQAIDHAREQQQKLSQESDRYRQHQLINVRELATIKANLLAVSEMLHEIRHQLKR